MKYGRHLIAIVMSNIMQCIYYGDCQLPCMECHGDDPFYKHQNRKIDQLKCCADCSYEELMQLCEAGSNFVKKEC